MFFASSSVIDHCGQIASSYLAINFIINKAAAGFPVLLVSCDTPDLRGDNEQATGDPIRRPHGRSPQAARAPKQASNFGDQVPRRSGPDAPSREAKEIKELKQRKRIKEEEIQLREALDLAPIPRFCVTYGHAPN